MENETNRGMDKGKGQCRKAWTRAEENALVVALKEICTQGWKSDNGTFRGGYTVALEKEILKIIPTTTIKANPHIDSKIKSWKKYYGCLSTMLRQSGFSWNDTTKTIVVDSDTVWEAYCKVDNDAKPLRNKSFPHWEDWKEIFGKDRATGEHAECPGDTVETLLREEEGQIEHDGLEEIDVSVTQTVASGSVKKKGDNEKKRKRKSEDYNSSITDLNQMFRSFCDDAKSHLGEMAKRIGHEVDKTTQRGKVIDKLSKLHLEMDDELTAASLIVSDPKKMDLFFSLDDERMSRWVSCCLVEESSNWSKIES